MWRDHWAWTIGNHCDKSRGELKKEYITVQKGTSTTKQIVFGPPGFTNPNEFLCLEADSRMVSADREYAFVMNIRSLSEVGTNRNKGLSILE